jgi:hypothetical protein
MRSGDSLAGNAAQMKSLNRILPPSSLHAMTLHHLPPWPPWGSQQDIIRLLSKLRDCLAVIMQLPA